MEPRMPRENYHHISAYPVERTSRSETEPEEAVRDEYEVEFEESTGEDEGGEEKEEDEDDLEVWKSSNESSIIQNSKVMEGSENDDSITTDIWNEHRDEIYNAFVQFQALLG